MRVYVLTIEQAWDGEIADTIVKVFKTKKSAKQYMHKFINDDGDETIVDYVKRKGWEVEINEPDIYRAYNTGYYPTDHIEITIHDCVTE